MKFTAPTVLLIFIPVSVARPKEATNDFPISINGTDLFEPEIESGYCTLWAYFQFDCRGPVGYAYTYGIDGCRTCEPFDHSHSYRLIGDCPWGYFVNIDGECSRISIQARRRTFNGTGCWNVDTDINWVSGYPCFCPGFHGYNCQDMEDDWTGVDVTEADSLEIDGSEISHQGQVQGA